MRILLAFDKFKGSLSASEACNIATEAIQELDLSIDIRQSPLTDGGEGFCEIVTQALDGVTRNYTVSYPDLRSGTANIGFVFLDRVPAKIRDMLSLPANGILAIVEMAQAAGHQLVPDKGRNPWKYSSHGVGEMIRLAQAEGASHFLMGMGGSATNDMGIGLLESFGLMGLDKNEAPIKPLTPANWERINRFEFPGIISPANIRIACDVRNPLHGENGAAAVFGPQKGLFPEDQLEMQESMKRIDHLIRTSFPQSTANAKSEGMGAAGGLPFGLSLAFETQLVPGFELICEILQLKNQLDAADIILTGEGALDESSLSGKGPYEMIRQGILRQKQVCVFSGKVFHDARQALMEDDQKIQINQVGDENASIADNIKNERINLKKRIQEMLPLVLNKQS